MGTLIDITLQRSILYTLASFVVSYVSYLSVCASFQIQTLSTYVGGANATNLGL